MVLLLLDLLFGSFAKNALAVARASGLLTKSVNDERSVLFRIATRYLLQTDKVKHLLVP